MPEYSVTYDSVDDAAAVAIHYLENGSAYGGTMRSDFTGLKSVAELKTLARDGWDAEVAQAMDIAESVIETVSAEHDMPAFQTRWDVTGSDVDVARYLDGDPECMIDYDMVATPKAGRVITLCASVCYSGVVSTTAIKRRGHAIAALAFALSRMGFAVELWADMSAKNKTGGKNGKWYYGNMRVLVKGANDELDPARIMFAYSHPGMLRGVGMPAMWSFPKDMRAGLNIGGNYGSPLDPKEDLPEGTIYLPSVTSDKDIPKPERALMSYLKAAGIVED